MIVPDSDSGILLRGEGKCQANIWGWPIGSGEVYGYRMDKNMPPEVRRGVTPLVNADKNIGEWNTFKITMKGNRMTVELNDILVIDNALLPGLPPSGRIGLSTPWIQKERRMGKSTEPGSIQKYLHTRITVGQRSPLSSLSV